ncbi:MAG: hypothetical protein PHX08_07755 [Lachnospiraceae bacterium]|nr:hypothetical protein [Lachnospiraceae bacterium]
MAQMNRNVNLEEIDSDALFGIDALKNQSIGQKIIFFGCVIGGVMLNVLLPLFYGVPRIVCVFMFLGLLAIGVAFGCNYTEDMTYGRYLYYFFFKPTKPLYYESTEDVIKIREKAVELKREEKLMLRQKQQADPEAQRKLLVKVIIFGLVLVIGIGAVFMYSSMKEDDNIHHRADGYEEVTDE